MPSATQDNTPTPGAAAPLIPIFLAFAGAYFLSYGLRSVNAAIAPYLTADLQLTTAGLGGLSAAYFIAFAALQWPLGHWLDRYGARRINAGLLLLAALGAGLMAASTSLTVATAGRALIGVGVAACLMAPMSYFRRCYPLEQQGKFNMWMLMAGTSGAVIATVPAETLAAALGWRSVFVVAAVLLLAASVAIFRLVPDRDLVSLNNPDEPEAPPVSLLRHPEVLRLMPMGVLGHGGIVALLTLWAGPWLTQVLGMSNAAMARALMMLMLALLAAYIIMSFLSPWLQRRGVSMMQIGIAGHILVVPAVITIALTSTPSMWPVWLLLALVFPPMSLVQPALAVRFPKAIAGRVLTLYNLFIFGGAFIMQWGIGVVIDLLALLGLSHAGSYQATALLLVGIQIACLSWYFIYGRKNRAIT